MSYIIKNWSKFQHQKDRRPPWIKLYRDILDDPDWHELDPVLAKRLVMLWLIASEDFGRLPDIRKLAFRFRISVEEMQNTLNQLSNWIDLDDGSNVVAECYQSVPPMITNEISPEQDAIPETETETETDTLSERLPTRKSTFKKPDDIEQSVWDAWLQVRKTKKATAMSEFVVDGIRREASKAGLSTNAALIACIESNWIGFNAGWYANKYGSSQPAKQPVTSDTFFDGVNVPAAGLYSRISQVAE